MLKCDWILHLPEEEYLEVIKDLHCEFDGHDAIDIWYGPQGPQWTSRGLLEKIAEQAESLGTNIQTHALESYIDKIEGHRSYGKSTIAYLDELGFLSPRLSMAHGTWLSQSDIETLAARGVNLIHCPSSNLRARQGIAPLNAAMQAGLLVALGMDGLTINDDDDLFNEMRLALQLHRTPEYDGRAPTTQEIVRMVTTDAARVMNRANEIGKLAPGYKADVLVLDLKEVVWPWVSEDADPLAIIVQRAHKGDVDKVLVNGAVAFEDAHPTGFDLNETVREIVEFMDAHPPNETMRNLNVRLAPLLVDWYQSWGKPEFVPFIDYNSTI